MSCLRSIIASVRPSPVASCTHANRGSTRRPRQRLKGFACTHGARKTAPKRVCVHARCTQVCTCAHAHTCICPHICACACRYLERLHFHSTHALPFRTHACIYELHTHARFPPPHTQTHAHCYLPSNGLRSSASLCPPTLLNPALD